MRNNSITNKDKSETNLKQLNSIYMKVKYIIVNTLFCFTEVDGSKQLNHAVFCFL